MSDSMGASELPISFANTAQAQLDDSKSAGQLLREAREANGLHVAALAVSLKVPVKKLEALEADRLEELPDAVFIRALASSVCRALKIDAAPILAKLPQLNTRMLDQSEKGVNVAFRTRADGPAPSMLAGLSRPVIFGVMALLLAAIVIILFPNFRANSASAPDTSLATAPAGNVANGVSMGNPVTVPSTPVGATETNSANAPANSATPAGETATLTTLSVTPALSTPTVPSPTAVITADGAQAAAVPADAIVVFAATGETWIEVRDGAGKVLMQRTLQAGERTGVGPPSRAPLAITVGRANLTQVSVRGKPFDLTPVSSKDAVAKFQVK
jgi:cytoskeleton protein RodZ